MAKKPALHLPGMCILKNCKDLSLDKTGIRCLCHGDCPHLVDKNIVGKPVK